MRGSADVAARAITAAKAQSVVLPGQDLSAAIIAELAGAILALHERVKTLDGQIQEVFAEHPQAEIIESMPGFGPILGASLLVGAGDLRAFPSAGHLAAPAGLVPVPNDSGRRTGNLHRPLRYSRPLRHVFYLSAQTSMMRDGPNRDYYLKKRGRGATHSQAVIALARRIDVCGLCCGRTEPGAQHHRHQCLRQLDNTIEIPNDRGPPGRRPRRGVH